MSTTIQVSQQPSRSAARILGETIRQEREAQQLTVDELAGYAGFHPSVLALIEEGVWIPEQEEVLLIAKALGVGWIQLSFLAMVADSEIEPRFVQRRRL